MLIPLKLFGLLVSWLLTFLASATGLVATRSSYVFRCGNPCFALLEETREQKGLSSTDLVLAPLNSYFGPELGSNSSKENPATCAY